MWKIKDPELKRKMNQFISDEGIDEVCRNEMSDSSTYIFFSFEDDAINFRIDKSYFEEFPRNMLDVWQPFPEERPLENGNYLVTRLMKTDTGVTVRFLDFGRFELANGIRTTQINQKVRTYQNRIGTFVGTFDIFDSGDSSLINILARRF